MLDEPRPASRLEYQPESAAAGAQNESALSPYLRAIRGRPFLFALVVIVTVSAGLVWLQVRTPRYETAAELLVDPVPADDAAFIGLPLLRESGDETRTLQTAAAVAESADAARLAAERLGGDWTVRRVQDDVEVLPEGQSNILSVTATASSEEEATALADAYAEAVVEVRRTALADAVDAAVGDVRRELADQPRRAADGELERRLAALLALRDREDPTITISEPAELPEAATGASAPVVGGLALLAGLVLACGAVVLLEALRPRPVRS